MNLIEALKGVIRKMIAPKTVENILQITPTISTKMKESIELWEDMYKDESPWLDDNVKSLGLASLIASEKARTATIEMEIKITGDNERATFIDNTFNKVLDTIRENLEYGIALGGFVIKPYVLKGPDDKYTLEFNYTKASDFYPLSFSAEGKVTEAAFIDRIITKETIYSKLEYHKLEGTDLHIYNYAFECNRRSNPTNSVSDLGSAIPLTSVSTWASLEPEVIIGNMDFLLFAYFKMPEANRVDLDSPLGASGFSRAVKLIEEADKLYSDLLWEFEGGQLAIDVDRTALNPIRDSKGNEKSILPKLQDRLYRRELDLGSDDLYNVFSPQLRDASIINGLNNQLMRIEDACAISRGTLSVVTQSEARTATELKILKQRSYAANQDIQKELQNVFEFVFKIIDKYCDLYDIVPSGKFEVAYKWDDSIIVDKDAERQQDLLEVNAGLMSKVEYRMKWYGETESQAEKALQQIDIQKQKDAEILQLTMSNNKLNDSELETDAAASYNKKVRANESVETNKKSSEN